MVQERLRREYRVAGADGTTYSAPANGGEFHTFPTCSMGFFRSGQRGPGETYLGYTVNQKVSQPSLFIRFLTTDGRTTAWQRAATYTAGSCYLGFWQTRVEVSAPGGSAAVSLIGGNSCAWTMSADAGWIHLSKNSGVGQTSAAITLDANPVAPNRTGHISINQQSIPVMQLGSAAAWSVDFYPAELDVSAAAGLHSVLAGTQPRDFGQFTADAPWISLEEIAIDPIGGPGNSQVWAISFRVEENGGESSRIGTISASGFAVTVRQAPGDIRLLPISDSVPAAGGTRLLSVKTGSPDRSWSATATVDWIQIGNPAGTGPAVLAYSVTPNLAPQGRTGGILFGNMVFWVTQAASGVSLPPSYTVKPLAGNIPDGIGGPAGNVLLDRPSGLAFDSQGNLYISDRLRRTVLRVAPDGTAARFAGSGACCFSGDGAGALQAALSAPDAIAVDANDNVFIADRGTARVRRVDKRGTITTVAGTGSGTAAGDNGPATAAGVWAASLAFDAYGNLLLCDSNHNSIRMVNARGVITTIAGTGLPGFSGDGGPARSAQFNSPEGIAVDAAGNILIADLSNGRVRRIAPSGTIGTLASGLSSPRDVKVDGAGNVLVAEAGGRIRRIRPEGGLETVAESGFEAGPYRLAIDGTGNLLLAQTSDSQVLRITPDGVPHAYAGLPQQGRLIDPRATAVDALGNLFIAEGEGRHLYQLGPDGSLQVIAANAFTNVRDLLALPDGTLLAADFGQNAILAIRNGAATKWAPTANAGLFRPSSLAADGAGNIYVVDSARHSLRRVAPDGAVTTIAGTGQPGPAGDGGPADRAQLNYPYTVAVDPADGSIYIAEWRRIRRIGPDQVIQTVLSADLPTTAIFARDPSGAFLIPDSAAPIISRMAPFEGTTVIAGSQIGVTTEEVNGRAAQFYQVTWIRADSQGNLYVTDSSAGRVYLVSRTLGLN